LENLKNRKKIINNTINYVLTDKNKKNNDNIINNKIKTEENNLLKLKNERTIGLNQIIDYYEKNLNSDNILEKIKEKNIKIQSYKNETEELFFFLKNRINSLKKSLLIKNNILKIEKKEKNEDIFFFKNKYKENLKKYEENDKFKKKKIIELEKVYHDLHILKKIIDNENTNFNNNLKSLTLKNIEANSVLDNKIKEIELKKENNIVNFKCIIENLKKKNENCREKIKKENDNFFNYKKNNQIKKETIYQNIQQKYKELKKKELLFKKNIEDNKKKINLKKERVKYLENKLKD